jgi:succinate-semialdehyde dehydrogenase / glutarate-semialdehyde dehydrogenase
MSSPARKGGGRALGRLFHYPEGVGRDAGRSRATGAGLHDAGLPAGVLNLVCGNPAEISEYLIPQPAVRLAETPFGGVKESGYGREDGTEGLACYTVTKNVSHKMM